MNVMPHIEIASGQPFVLVDCAQLTKDFFRMLRHDQYVQYRSLFEDTPDQTSVMSGPHEKYWITLS
jgi:hypothetical protein